jgi:dephospho-CoA kinase
MYYPELPPMRWRRSAFAVGLTGAIGAGKSTATRAFAAAGAAVLDADQVAREVLHSSELRAALIEALGADIVGTNGALDRERIAARVFADADARERLNALVHPAVWQRFKDRIAGAPAGEVLVCDIPLLFENEREAWFDLTIVISAPEDVRLRRVMERSGWTAEEFRRREAAQTPLAEKERRADLTLKNVGAPADLEAAVRHVYEEIVKAGQQSAGESKS